MHVNVLSVSDCLSASVSECAVCLAMSACVNVLCVCLWMCCVCMKAGKRRREWLVYTVFWSAERLAAERRASSWRWIRLCNIEWLWSFWHKHWSSYFMPRRHCSTAQHCHTHGPGVALRAVCHTGPVWWGQLVWWAAIHNTIQYNALNVCQLAESEARAVAGGTWEIRE